MFSLCFRSKRLSKKASQKQAALVGTCGHKELTTTGIAVLQHLHSCSFLTARAVLFLTTMLSLVSRVAAEMEKQHPLHFTFTSCNGLSTPLKWKELCRNSKKVMLGSLFCLPQQRETTGKGLQTRHREPQRKPQVSFFPSELVFSEASSLSTRDTVQICQVTLRDSVNSNNPDVN